jgi:hypothetical protein
MVLGIVCAAVIGIAALSNDDSSPSPNSSTNKSSLVADSQPNTEQVSPSAPEPLSMVSIRLAAKHYGLSRKAGGPAGLMIYSQNCYEALGRQFSWSRLDTCGAFDQRAASDMTDEVGTEATYFENETVAGRYLALAVKGGEEPAAADQRLASLQGRIASSVRSVAAAAPIQNGLVETASTFVPADELSASASAETMSEPSEATAPEAAGANESERGD